MRGVVEAKAADRWSRMSASFFPAPRGGIIEGIHGERHQRGQTEWLKGMMPVTNTTVQRRKVCREREGRRNEETGTMEEREGGWEGGPPPAADRPDCPHTQAVGELRGRRGAGVRRLRGLAGGAAHAGAPARSMGGGPAVSVWRFYLRLEDGPDYRSFNWDLSIDSFPKIHLGLLRNLSNEEGMEDNVFFGPKKTVLLGPFTPKRKSFSKKS